MLLEVVLETHPKEGRERYDEFLGESVGLVGCDQPSDGVAGVDVQDHVEGADRDRRRASFIAAAELDGLRRVLRTGRRPAG